MRVTHCDRQASVFSVEELEELHGSFGCSFRVRLRQGTCDFSALSVSTRSSQLCGRERGIGSICRPGVRYAFRVHCISGGVPANPGRGFLARVAWANHPAEPIHASQEERTACVDPNLERHGHG
ncbi:hypothetical protein PIB30_012621 [Stylosanthes scabra]|uniref:Uncharacterized protein n=1 Tax=Stylosanthes scabra TaxID=79078 RepID=A0ABU6Y3B4_9FABA|nr:hypothetical protein [Stylosanthes scabra]